MSTKKTKTFLTISEKLELIRDHNSGQYNTRQLSTKYGISVGAVSNAIKNKEKLLNVEKNKQKFKYLSKEKNEKLNEIVLKFIQSANATKVPINGPVIQVFAKETANEMNLNGFKASNGWLEKFLKRNSIKFSTISGESADVSQEVVDEWTSGLSALTEGFDPKDVFNFDESALFYKIMPKKSYLTKNSDQFGGKKSKNRLTIGLCCSMTGEKLKPVIIGMD